MDNMKTGSLIRELRKEKGLTQNDLAQQLHITDRAVSKWERGLCAPDISLIEPLASILGLSVVELISGERVAQEEEGEIIETAAKTVIKYSQSEVVRKIKTLNRKYALFAVVCFCAVLLLCSHFFWRRGDFFIIEKRFSPDGNSCAIVYDKGMDGKNFSMNDAVSLIVDLDNGSKLRVTYGDCEYRGLWWSPDGQKYVLALDNYNGGAYLELASIEQGSSKNLIAYLSMGVEATELAKYGATNEVGWPRIEYQFLQWSKDSRAMLFYYSFLDEKENVHEGYFWYNCENGTVNAVLELEKESSGISLDNQQ